MRVLHAHVRVVLRAVVGRAGPSAHIHGVDIRVYDGAEWVSFVDLPLHDTRSVDLELGVLVGDLECREVAHLVGCKLVDDIAARLVPENTLRQLPLFSLLLQLAPQHVRVGAVLLPACHFRHNVIVRLRRCVASHDDHPLWRPSWYVLLFLNKKTYCAWTFFCDDCVLEPKAKTKTKKICSCPPTRRTHDARRCVSVVGGGWWSSKQRIIPTYDHEKFVWRQNKHEIITLFLRCNHASMIARISIDLDLRYQLLDDSNGENSIFMAKRGG